LDTFIVIGELLMLRGSLAGRWDWWAVSLMLSGSTGSIALNITGVGADAGPLDYTVAAVPPVAALLAFGALMRQLHEAIKAYMAPVITPGARTVPDAGPVVFDGNDHPELYASLAPGYVDPFDDDEGMTGMPVNATPPRPHEAPEPGPDAMRYRPGDEDGMDADVDALRRPARGFSADLMTGDETVAAAIRDLPDARLEFDARDLEIHRPRPDTDVPDILDWSMSRLIVPAADVPDMWSAPVGTPEPGTNGQPPAPWAPVYGPVRGYRDTDTRDTGTGRDTAGQTPPRGVPADTPPLSRDTRTQRTRTRRTTGITAAVRNLIADTPDISDDEIKAALSDHNPDSVRKSINRVRSGS